MLPIQVSCWIGCVPRDHTSDERKSHGPITKAGNSRLRRALVEGCSGMGRRNAARKKPSEGQAVSEAVERMAGKANARLLKRYRHLAVDLGKHPYKAKVAVASELARSACRSRMNLRRRRKGAPSNPRRPATCGHTAI